MHVFTVDSINKGYFQNGEPKRPIENICFNSWKKKHDITVYDYNHPLINEAYLKYKDYCDLCIKNKKYNFLADVYRLYIMSKIPDSLYFDCDYYCTSNEIVIPDIFSCQGNCFCLMTNGKDLEAPEKMLSVYKNATDLIKDNNAIKLSGIKVGAISPMGVHICDFDTHYFCYSNDFEHFRKVAEKYMALFPEYKKALNFYTEVECDTVAEWLNKLDLHYINGKRADIRPKIITNVDEEDKIKIINLIQNQEGNFRFIQ